MKKILLAVTAALAITSCSQNEEFENEGQKTEINFTTIVSKATRASELKTEKERQCRLPSGTERGSSERVEDRRFEN